DVMMPNVDGFAVCQHIRSMDSEETLPILMLTGLDDIASIEHAYAMGATEFALKPINWTLLPKRVSYMLKSSKAMRELRLSEERYALAASAANDGLWDWDLSTGVIYYSPRWRELIGDTSGASSASPKEWLSRVHPSDVTRVRAEIRAHLDAKTDHFESRFRIAHRRLGYRWMLSRGLAVRGRDGIATRLAGSMSDISAQVAAQEKLEHDALHDALTGLPNRVLFLDRLGHCLDIRGRRPEFEFVVLFFDLDRFKLVNDSLGHIVGDKLLVEVSARVKGLLRNSDTLARLGGDEFTILLEHADAQEDLDSLLERIQSAIRAPYRLNGELVRISTSIGVVRSSERYTKPEEMLRDADAAMYKAKARGGGCHVLFDQHMHVEAMSALRLESELREALQRQELELEYQPIVSLADTTVIGFEALLRWQHPRAGRLLPEAFLPIAIESHQIKAIGQWVLEEACARLADWRRRWSRAADWFVSINISHEELEYGDLATRTESCLGRFELPPACLRFEFTESTLIRNDAVAKAVLSSLKKLGVRLAIDDFGRGNSSFKFLHSFQFDTLKIDRSLVTELASTPHYLGLVKSMTHLAKTLGLRVNAEGAESADVTEILKALKCDSAQGFSLGLPCNAEQLSRLFDEDGRLLSLQQNRDVGGP
ncbi:MAG: EAL domain-containing protein, partial [Gammaproteobacteria bacterium]|nr:EAL domain-containing protein [Gammaproteobacteria bacterium]